ncbi:Peptide methionine sulfoxide reductase MsrA 2 [wastewater metagenome]|uniref:peptide-methionine (S)-S-oxide reductase n=2 Tax=unclassified sequences TaxID=12908 RepID=A0A5B8R9A1_9ZZZZ|nr:peptide-methionine (S)-S-oxide reductase MsrA [Arhodomonas sp. KWT]QEA05121.1 peptide methionine sulfoxide reductase MsrA 2 [uncultured organism]
MSETDDTALATLGGGCFWCLEAVFQELPGVQSVTSGYAGGDTDAPTYEAVCRGDTGHAEVVQIAYDPSAVTYRELLGVFFAVHDPTTLNRQGHDVGPQYRSVILYHDDDQKADAEAAIAELEREGVFADPVVTEVVPLTRFHPAEDYHQNYFRNHPEQGYCQVVIAPKLAAFRRRFSTRPGR